MSPKDAAVAQPAVLKPQKRRENGGMAELMSATSGRVVWKVKC